MISTRQLQKERTGLRKLVRLVSLHAVSSRPWLPCCSAFRWTPHPCVLIDTGFVFSFRFSPRKHSACRKHDAALPQWQQLIPIYTEISNSAEHTQRDLVHLVQRKHAWTHRLRKKSKTRYSYDQMTIVAIYQIILGWETYKYFYETDELPNSRPTQPKKR